MTEPLISVGIITGEDYTVTRGEGYTEVGGVVIGRGFHWERKAAFRYEGELLETRHGLVNRLPVERYIASVISSEMNPAAPKEFLRAHAIISRSWAMRKLTVREHPGEGKQSSESEIITWQESDAHVGFDVCSDDHCQRYQGMECIDARVMEAIESTRGTVLYDDAAREVADARFSKCCGGTTELFSTCWADREMPYLKAVKDPYCDPARLPDGVRKRVHASILKEYDDGTDYFDWHAEAPRCLVRANLKERFGRDIGEVTALVPLDRGASGRIRRLRVEGSSGAVVIGKELAIRRLLSPSHLFSSAFSVKETPDGFILSGRGWGHGVGLCQIGAAVMASEGKTAEEILSFYFPGTSLKKIY